ncbi:MAG TPA: hypothetical protein GX731_09395 [Clostridiales bacterium]|nr:hypothetical protein [Clostridiales bacterium]
MSKGNRIGNRIENRADLFQPTVGQDDKNMSMESYRALSVVNRSKGRRVTHAGYKRATYYIHPVLEEAISVYAFENGVDKSYIVREALNEYLGDLYLQKGLERYNESK